MSNDDASIVTNKKQTIVIEIMYDFIFNHSTRPPYTKTAHVSSGNFGNLGNRKQGPATQERAKTSLAHGTYIRW